MNIQTIEAAVQNLPPQDLAEFRRWFSAFDAETWDAQIERDASSGKLQALAQEAIDEFKNGRASAF